MQYLKQYRSHCPHEKIIIPTEISVNEFMKFIIFTHSFYLSGWNEISLSIFYTRKMFKGAAFYSSALQLQLHYWYDWNKCETLSKNWVQFIFIIFSTSRFLSFHLSQISNRRQHQGGSMPNTSSSVPFLLSNSMQSIRSRRTSTCLSSGPLGSGSGLLQQLGSGMVRQLTSVSGTASPVHHQYNGNSIVSNSNNNSINNLSSTGPPTSRGNYVRKCPSLNITFSTH